MRPRIRLVLLFAPAAASLAGCGGDPTQSALHPAGPDAAKIATLWWVMCAAFSATFALVLALTAVAVLRRTGGGEPPLGRHGFVLAGGVALPLAVLLPLLVFSLETSAALRSPGDALTVRVVGYMWWWEVRYPEQGIVTANEVQVPVGRTVRLELASADVIHSFWVPSLHGKRDMIPVSGDR